MDDLILKEKYVNIIRNFSVTILKILQNSSISAQIFNVILQYIYGGTVGLENYETRFIYDLMLVADEFEFEELTNKLETLLIETKGSWLRTHFSFIYHSIFSRNNFEKLKDFCNDIIVKYPNLIFDADAKWKKIWDYVIKWEIAHTSTFPINLDDWTKENFLILNIEVIDKIEPYRKILDKQLWKDINQHLLILELPVKSIILLPRSVLVTELPPRTQDGFAPQSFLNICHGHACTVVMAKVKRTDEIIGGYNPLAWDKNTGGE
ncbi:hypothetical protein Glove_213g90 [Diversispora epigaea]|uniref:Uncharacterized protein n=1 Tax=Diversispora epigaea TaxID=1348612 RepID=A0A397IS64_9GLOM|nr:hypothetical protein Glove_213g90 [Diversispora epigaea]